MSITNWTLRVIKRSTAGGVDNINIHFINVKHFQIIKIIFKNFYFKMTWSREGLVGWKKKSIGVEGVWERIIEDMVTMCYIQVGNC